MCPYMSINDKDIPQCEPKKQLCTMCVLGNENTYKEIKKQEKERDTD